MIFQDRASLANGDSMKMRATITLIRMCSNGCAAACTSSSGHRTDIMLWSVHRKPERSGSFDDKLISGDGCEVGRTRSGLQNQNVFADFQTRGGQEYLSVFLINVN